MSTEEIKQKFHIHLNESGSQEIDLDFEGLSFDEICQKLKATPIEDVHSEIFKKYNLREGMSTDEVVEIVGGTPFEDFIKSLDKRIREYKSKC